MCSEWRASIPARLLRNNKSLLCPARARRDNYSSWLNHLPQSPLVLQLLASVPLSLFSGLPPPANSEVLQHYGLLLFSLGDNDGCGQSVAVEVVRTCMERGKQFKVCCRLKLRHAVSFGFIRRLASISSIGPTHLSISHIFQERVWVLESVEAAAVSLTPGSIECWSIIHCCCASTSSVHQTCLYSDIMCTWLINWLKSVDLSQLGPYDSIGWTSAHCCCECTPSQAPWGGWPLAEQWEGGGKERGPLKRCFVLV